MSLIEQNCRRFVLEDAFSAMLVKNTQRVSKLRDSLPSRILTLHRSHLSFKQSRPS
jgi:hypothetical protein